MDINDPKILALRHQVTAAQEEFDMAVTFHEAWKPTAYDADLHRRMSNCFAGNTFRVVRIALRREMILALMRLWTHTKNDVRLEIIAATLRDGQVINTLAVDRASRIGIPGAEFQMREDLSLKAGEAIGLVDKYAKGSHRETLKALQRLRNERLAHRTKIPTALEAAASDDEIESFYQDMSKLISLLLTLVHATAYDPQETGQVHRTYAEFFWAAVRGETTEGHPRYRAGPNRAAWPASN